MRLPLLQRLLLRLLGLYPPFLGAGIRTRRLAGGGYRISMRLHWWNRNFVGTHFGGSLYAMTDPFFVLALFERLGWEYVIWNKRSRIEFLEPGRGVVTAEFQVSDRRVAEIRQAADRDGRTEPEFTVEITDQEGEVVARVIQTLYVRRKQAEVSGDGPEAG